MFHTQVEVGANGSSYGHASQNVGYTSRSDHPQRCICTLENEGKAGWVPPTQSVREIVDKVHSVLIRVHIEEGRGTSNSSKDTPGPYALDFFEDMYTPGRMKSSACELCGTHAAPSKKKIGLKVVVAALQYELFNFSTEFRTFIKFVVRDREPADTVD